MSKRDEERARREIREAFELVVREAMACLSDSDRADVIASLRQSYCFECGTSYVPCNCMRDE